LVLWILCALAIAALESTHIWLLTFSEEVETSSITASAVHAVVILYFAFVVINAVVEISRAKGDNRVAPPTFKKMSTTSEILDDEATGTAETTM
jgi:hypothetical protein